MGYQDRVHEMEYGCFEVWECWESLLKTKDGSRQRGNVSAGCSDLTVQCSLRISVISNMYVSCAVSVVGC